MAPGNNQIPGIDKGATKCFLINKITELQCERLASIAVSSFTINHLKIVV